MNTGNYFLIAIIVSIIIVVGTVGSFYATEWEPVVQEREKLTSDIESVKRDIADLEKIDDQIKKLKKEKEELEEKKKKLQTDSVSLDDVVPLLLDSIEIIANKFDITFQDIRISPLVRAEDWSELPVELMIQGTFDNINCFLTVVEKRKLINLAAGSMSISVSSDLDKDTGSPKLSVQLSAKVYIL